MSGKGAKGLIMGKASSSAVNGSSNRDKDKKKSVTRSSRAGLQVTSLSLYLSVCVYKIYSNKHTQTYVCISNEYKSFS